MYQWIVFVHIAAAIVWIGGMFFVALVLVPVLRRESAVLRATLLDAVGRRFRTVGWVALGVLLVTGVWNLRNRRLSWEPVLSGDVFEGEFGRILLVKLLFVLLTLLLSTVHDWFLGPTSIRLAREGGAGAEARAASARRTASWVARVNALVALVIVFLAVSLVRGLPWWP